MRPTRLVVALTLTLLATMPTVLSLGGTPAADPAATDWSALREQATTCAVPAAEAGSLPVDVLCPAAIRPGARMTSPAGCTMNFIVTDGTEYHIGTAGHCVTYIGQPVHLAGIGYIGDVAMRFIGPGDWAFVRIDPSRHHLIDPTMCRYAGPYTLTEQDAVRAPLPGDPILHYGHGFVWGATDATRARGSAVVLPWAFHDSEFVFAGIIAPGDSGSPIRFATGEAAGIAVAHLRLDPFGVVPSVAFGARFDKALENLTAYLGRPFTVVEGGLPPPEAPLAGPPLLARPPGRAAFALAGQGI